MTDKYNPVFTYYMITFCSLVFITNFFLPTPVILHFLSNFALIPSTFYTGKHYLALLTYQFIHLNFQHLISNMFVLFAIGRAIESETGTMKFGASYIGAGIGSGFLHVFFNQSSETMVIGASGAIFGAIAILLLLMPFRFTSAMIVPVPGVVLGITMLVVEVISILFGNDTWIAHDIHLYGFLFGGIASFSIDYNKALRGLIISVVILLGLYYWAFYIEGVLI
jgi:membrane associated rhomboid family serine protease